MPNPEDLKKMFAHRMPSRDQAAAHQEVFTPGLILAETIDKHTPDGAVKDLAIHLVLIACHASLGAMAVGMMHEPEEPAPSAGAGDESAPLYPEADANESAPPTGEGDGAQG